MIQRILLGVNGSIAAYKAAQLVRLLTGQGLEVRVLMSRGAQAFVTPLTFQALSGQPVASELLDAGQESAMGHIELARWADLILIAPASANSLARLAVGLADDLLGAVCLASRAPLWLAPAMNSAMWQHPASQANLALLQQRGAHLLEPERGELACGEQGDGRMMEPAQILQRLLAAQPDQSKPDPLRPTPLKGQRALVTAGPTQEPLDPVRYLGNRSSGKMGYALAEALRDAGAEVCLISGPVALPGPAGVERILVEQALQMHRAVLDRVQAGGVDLFIACAAVADYRPVRVATEKIKKGSASLHLELQPNPDILAEVAALPAGLRPFCVGFAAETQDLEQQAEAKRQAKRVDLLAANRVGPGLGFGQEDNQLLLLWADGRLELPLLPKRQLAQRLVEQLVKLSAASCQPPAKNSSWPLKAGS
ncbi:bifunctional phosphopantothenoylcysteine decarboxylase/phosphopantothenate--cysteine ligase CoaBC [Magnetovirga frankeli]|uniref:bifunctional phosphopantothenoylcysteine decarboxylase/phosphopantothenate--cysteine ligase CoaBC n=1 Tax=Magnetovirga frankeli TaxID=947516 RepID=UPI003D3415EB